MSAGEAPPTKPALAGEAPSMQPVLAVLAARALVSSLVLLGGFRAMSDDDYARVVIAQSFAAHPGLDPSGTSWLPLPFWVQGSVMLLFGPTLSVARATAFVAGLLAALVVFVAARWFGASPKGALLGALIACLVPYSAWLGVATVPDGPTAALLLLAMAATREPLPRRWLIGACALLAATLSRYEAWPVAAGFALWGMLDALRTKRWEYVLAATVALVGPLAWMTHGALHHGDATFFVTRVAAYRHAIGAGSGSVLARFSWCPLALVRCEPELVALVLGTAVIARKGGFLAELGRYRRAFWLAVGLMVFLVVGDLGGGAATHHRERSLLVLWLLGAVLSGDWLASAWSKLRPAAFVLPVVVLGTCFGVRPWSTRRDTFVDRAEEIKLGERARTETRTSPARLLVDTKDYGFFAVMAAFGRPAESTPADDHDPRRRAVLDAFSSEGELKRRLGQAGARWLVATREHAGLARQVGTLVAETPRLVLVERAP